MADIDGNSESSVVGVMLGAEQGGDPMTLIGGGIEDANAPVVNNFVPALGTQLTAQQPVQFDVTDAEGKLSRIIVMAVFADGVVEVVHDGDNWRGYYGPSSQRIIIENGWRYTVLRFGGWPSSPSTFNVIAIDQQGNESA